METPDDEDPPRLVFYKEDVERITSVLAAFLRNAKARAVLLVDKDGPVLTKEGSLASGEMEALSELAADSFTSNAFGKRTYSLLSFERDHLQLCPVGRRTILAVVYGDDGSLGMIRLYAAEVTGQLGELFTEIERRGRQGPDSGEGAGAAVRA